MISQIAIRRHIATLMLTLTVIVLGIFFTSTLRVDLLPAITYPRIGLRLEAPGVSPEVAINEITRPLEEAMSATEGVIQVYSQTREGRISVDLFFRPGGNIDQALNDATAALNRARSELPNTVEEPRLFKFEPSQSPIYEMAVTSNSLNPLQLRLFANEELSRELSIVPGVAAVDVAGGVEEEVNITIDLKRLQSLQIGLNDVVEKLEQSNRDISGGRILGPNAEPLTRARGKFENIEQIENLAFVTPTNQKIYLRDFAQIIDASKRQRVFVTLNGKNAVRVSIQKQPDANTIEVTDAVKQKLEQLRQQGIITSDMLLIPTLDESKFIRNALTNVITSGVSGALLAAIAVLLFLGSLRQTLIIVISIPLAIFAALILMGMFNIGLNVISLGGLALGVGIVVDNSIVMLETIAEGVGLTPGSPIKTLKVQDDSQEFIDTVIASSQKVESALLASTSTNLVAVLPFLFIGGLISLLFNQLILTISFAVGASILVAVTIVPMLASRMLAWPVSSGVSRLGILQAFNERFEYSTKNYQLFLEQIIKKRILVITITTLILGGSAWVMVGQIPQQVIKRVNTGQAVIFAQFPPGTTLETNIKVMETVKKIISDQPETEYVFATVGGFIFGNSTNENPLRSSVNITVTPGSNIESYITVLNKEFEKLNLVNTGMIAIPGQLRGIILNNSPVGNADIDVILQSENQQNLLQAGELVLQNLREKVTKAGFRPDQEPPQEEIQIIPDYQRIADLNVNIQDIGDTLATAVEGIVPTQLQRNERLVDIRLQLDPNSIRNPSQLQNLPIFTEDNQLIRLGDLAKIVSAKSPTEIKRINQRSVFLLAGSLNKGANLGEAIAEVNQVLAQVKLPPGVNLLPSSAAESNRQIQSSLPILGGLAVFLVFVVMAVQYNSLIDPLVIMFTVPLALAGGIWGLYFTNTAISATVVVGAVLLVGIVVNNAIIMVEFANQLYEEEKITRRQAILKAAPERLRPILMTTITTVVGMFPLALGLGEGGELLQPLGVVVFAGLSVATVLTLFIIPCFYVLLHK